MTTLARAAPAGTGRPVPWTKLVWVTWRQHRVALIGVAALLGGLALFLLVKGLRVHSGYAAVTSCRPAKSAAWKTTDGPMVRM